MTVPPRTAIRTEKWARQAGFALLLLLAAGLLQSAGCKSKEAQRAAAPAAEQTSVIRVSIENDGIHMHTPVAEFLLKPSGYLQANLKSEGQMRTLEDPAMEPGQQVIAGHTEVSDFVFDLAHAKVGDAAGKLGRLGKHIEVPATSGHAGLQEALTIEVYDDFPALALLSATLRNIGQKDVILDSVSLQRHRLNAHLGDAQAAPHEMWSFHGSSLKWGKDDVLPVPAKFSQENPFGIPVEVGGDLGRVGGGIPVVAFWTRNVGEAIGHIETLPLVLSIPVATTNDESVLTSVRLAAKTMLKPGDVYSTPRTFLAVYKGDYYQPLSMWSNAVEREGLARPANNEENYAVSWCGWGYESDVTPSQMLATIPKLKELGIHWATLDDRWFNNYGDWKPRTDTFPGDAIQKMASNFHARGIKLQLWWLPLAVEDGHHGYGGQKFVVSEVVKEHPDWLVLDKNGKPARMTRNLATLCPAVPGVRAYYKQLTERFIRDWGFDGHKLDNIYATPPCYNPKHHHKSPLDSVYAMGEVYKTIFETTRALKPDSVTQSCPCGTPPSLAWFRYMDQAVTADPVGSVQVRRRIKMYKALLGPRAAIYGDHVELTRIIGEGDKEQDLGDDFASTLGTGGVLGTKFTWPDYGPKLKDVYLKPDKEAHWKKWIDLYNAKMLSKGNFRDLYVYGYDLPEAYAIEKDGSMFYAFYAPEKVSLKKTTGEKWRGEVELRGLEAGKNYKIADYVNNRDYGLVAGPTAKLTVEFMENLLLEAAPSDANR
ncbi:MAG TPA: alpha-galactosidase [Candidatus Dormibacteraeota bacterium]|nr:alpha-galactosidase [Candidatus Dormibacteraeota bacterium]